MKLLIITPSYYPALKYGGPIESVHLLVKALKLQQNEVDILTTNAGQVEQPLEGWVLIDGVRVKYCKYYFYEHFTFSPGLFFQALKIIKKYDLVYVLPVWNFPSLSTSLICKILKKPYIISPRGALNKQAFNLKRRFIKKIFFELFYRFVFENASSIHYTSKNEQEEVSCFLRIKNKSFVLSNGIDLSKFVDPISESSFKQKYLIPSGKRYILFIGRISKIKGLDLLIKAFKDLCTVFNDLVLVIAGPDNYGYKKEVQNWVESNNLIDNVVFAGDLRGRDKLSAYSYARLLVLPSYSENFGMVVIEALACGIPVVVSENVGVAQDGCLRHFIGVSKLSSKSLAFEIRKILNPDFDRLAYSKKAIKIVKDNYDINVIAREFINECKIVLESKNQ